MNGRSNVARSKRQPRFERHQLGELISRIEAVAATERPPTLIAIAGRGGAGKTTLAARISARLEHASVVHTDDFARPGIPGWDWRFTQQVIEPLLRNEPAQYQRYDWGSDQLAEWHRVEPGGVLIVEGVSSTRRELDVAWDLTIWVEAPTPERLRRGIARDGEHTRQQWEEVWEPQEDAYIESQHPDQRADVIVDLSDHRAEAQPAANTIAKESGSQPGG
jgi:uridine kinase